MAASASALQSFELLAQALDFLLGQVVVLLGLLKGGDDAFEVAQDGFQAVADAIDLPTEDAIEGTVAVVAIITGGAFAGAATIWAAAVKFPGAFGESFRRAGPGWPAILDRLAIGVGSFFVKIFGFVMVFSGRFRSAFAFGHGFGDVFAIFDWLVVVRRVLGAERFAFGSLDWRAVVNAGGARWRAASASAAGAGGAVAITAVAGAFARAVSGGPWASGRGFGITGLRSGVRGGQRLVRFKRGWSRRFGGAFRTP